MDMQNGNCCQCINTTTDNEKVLKRFSCLTSLYTYLSRHFKHSKMILYRNLSYVRECRSVCNYKNDRNIESICEYLYFNKQYQDESTNILSKFDKSNEKYTFKFNGFFDGDSENNWETVEAVTSITVVHYWKDRRKGKKGRKCTELVKNIELECNPSINTESVEKSFYRSKLFQDTEQYRLSYSYLKFNIRALERRRRQQLPSQGNLEKIQEANRTFPVYYETRFPIYDREKDELYLLDGGYELRLDVAFDHFVDDDNYKSSAKDVRVRRNEYEMDHQNNIKMEVEKQNGEISDNDEKYMDDELLTDDDSECEQLNDALPKWIGGGHGDCNDSTTLSIRQENKKSVREYSRWPRIIFKLNIATSKDNAQSEIAKDCSDAEDDASIDPITKFINGILKAIEKEPSKCIIKPVLTPQIQSVMDCQSVQIKQQKSDAVNSSSIKLQIAYKIFNKDKLIQWTYSDNLRCPWCGFERNFETTVGIQCLMQHLRAFHSRFMFQCYLIPLNGTSPNIGGSNSTINNSTTTDSNHLIGITKPSTHPFNISINTKNLQQQQYFSYAIDIKLNDSFDGSIEVGLRRVARMGIMIRPEKRQLYTQIIYSKRAFEPALSRVRDRSIDLKPVVWGHNRDYFHTTTGILQSVNDLEDDSEREDNPKWLQKQYYKRIEEFMDVNPGEKRIMQLWNLHLLRFRYHGDYALPILVQSFIKDIGIQMKEENLRNNLILHLCNLVDYGLLMPTEFCDAMSAYDAL